jgi:redox-sensitive bicupin YhaK (pirin superfamily)
MYRGYYAGGTNVSGQSLREIRATYAATRTLEGAGVPIRRALPTPNGRYDLVDPFLLLDDVKLQPSNEPSFPAHPHRGFEILTYLVTGGMSHEDSEGNKAGVGPGGLQHIVAGKGIWHGEAIDATAGPMRGLQMWINLPRAEKGIDPRYELVDGPEVPVTRDGAATVRRLAGEGGAVSFARPSLYRDVTVDADAEVMIDIPDAWQGFAYVIDGGGQFGRDGDVVGPWVNAILGTTGALRVVAGPGGVRFILGAAMPIGEAPRWRGPYVD